MVILTTCCLLSLAFDELPDGEQIPYVKELGSQDDDLISNDSSSSEALYSSRKLHPPVLISDGIPPVPLRLLKRVKQGLFVEMSNCLIYISYFTYRIVFQQIPVVPRGSSLNGLPIIVTRLVFEMTKQ